MADLTQYQVQNGERSSYAKYDGLLNTVQGSLNAIGDQAKNIWGTGLIVAPSQLSQGGAVTNQTLVRLSGVWVPTTVRSRSTFTTTATVDIVNDAAQRDLFTGNLATSGSAGFLLPTLSTGHLIRFVAGGNFFNNSGAGRKITLQVGLTNGGVFSPMWGDLSTNIGVNAARIAWRIRGEVIYRGSNSAYCSGVFAMSDTQAATTGLGPIRDTTRLSMYTTFVGTDLGVDPSARRFVLSLTQETNNVNLSMQLLFARVEVTS
jgi:hypothetical protein